MNIKIFLIFGLLNRLLINYKYMQHNAIYDVNYFYHNINKLKLILYIVLLLTNLLLY